MTRFNGMIGVKQDPVETSPGIFTEDIFEVKVTGRLDRLGLRWSGGELSQNEVNAGHVLSLVASDDVVIKFMNVVYVIWRGKKWTVRSVDINHPRINLSLGGMYNG